MDISNKKIVFLGDSITKGIGTTSPEKRYFEVIAKKTGAICKGYGIGSTCIAKNKRVSEVKDWDKWFNSRVVDMDKDADVVTVFGGTNDYGRGDAPLGTIDDNTEDTFYGALNVLYSNLIKTYPNARIVIITPTHRLEENNLFNDYGDKNPTNLKGYVDIIIEVANKFNFAVFDFYNELYVYPEIAHQRELYMPDGLHPSDAGNELMADLFIEKIKHL